MPLFSACLIHDLRIHSETDGASCGVSAGGVFERFRSDVGGPNTRDYLVIVDRFLAGINR